MTKIPTILLALFLAGYKMFTFPRERVGWGASENSSDLKKTTLLNGKWQTALDRSQRDLKLLQRSLSGQINTEVTRAQQRLNLEKIAIFRKQRSYLQKYDS